MPKRSLIDNPYAKVWIEDNIMFVLYNRGIIISEDVQQSVAEARKEVGKGKSWPIIVDAQNVKYWTLEARRKGFSDESLKDVLAFAVISKNKIAITTINWVNSFLNKKVPLKLFSTKQKAITWIKKLELDK